MTATRTFNRDRGTLNGEGDLPLTSVVGSVGSLLNKIFNDDDRDLILVVDQVNGKVYGGVKATLDVSSGWANANTNLTPALRAVYAQAAVSKFETGQIFNKTSGSIPGDDSAAPLNSLAGSITALVNKMLDIDTETALIVCDQGAGTVKLYDATNAAATSAIASWSSSSVTPIQYTVAAAKAFE